MSALTDIFSALANKIRSKTGGSETYTPAEMVSDGIDDVYDAGVAAGETTHTQTYTPATNTAANDMGVTHEYRYVNTSGMITPSGNKSITANGTGIDVKNYATASVAVPDPTLTGDAASGDVLSGKTYYKDSLTKQTGSMTNRGAWTSTGNNCNASTTKDVTIPAGYHNGSGYVRFNSLSSQTGVDSGKTAIDASHVHSGYQGWVNGSKISGTYTAPTITSITPSNSSPVSMSANNNYKPSSSGYAISSYSSVTPSASGEYFASGMVKMSSSGYAYDSQPGAETTLWTNPSPTSSFAGQTVSLNDNIYNYRYIKVNAKVVSSSSTSGTTSVIYTPDDIKASTYTGTQTNGKPICGICGYTNTGSSNARWLRFFKIGSTNREITFKDCERSGAAGSNSYLIPTSIIGIK